MISGYIRLKDNTTVTVTDANLVSNSLSVQMSVCRNSAYQIGTFNASTMNIGIIDDDAASKDFTDAKIVLQKTEDGTSLKLGEFYVDGTKTKRYKSQIRLYAQDGSAVFDTEIPDAMREAVYNSAYDALLTCCNAVGVAL